MNESEAERLKLGRRLRAQRLQAHLSMRHVARRARVAVSYVSNLEAGRVSATLASLRKVLIALGTDLAPFFAESPAVPLGCVFRRHQMQRAAQAARSYTFIFPARRDIHVMMLDEELFAGERPEYESLSGDLAGYVLSGELLLEVIGKKPQTLMPGDGFYIPAGLRVRGHCNNAKSVRLVTLQLEGSRANARGGIRHRGNARLRPGQSESVRRRASVKRS